MKKILILAITLLLSLSIKAYKVNENDIILLQQYELEKSLQQFPNFFMGFFSASCQHCKNFYPTFTTLAKEFQKLPTSERIQFAEVDCDTQPKICRNFNIDGYPTLVLMKSGAYNVYQDSREEQILRNWLKKRSQPNNIHINNMEQLKDIQKQYQKENLAIYYGKTKKDPEFHAFGILSGAMSENVYSVHTFNQTLIESLNLVRLPYIQLFKQGQKIEYDQQDFTIQEQENFFMDQVHPSIQEYNENLKQSIFHEGTPSILLITETPQSQDSDNEDHYNKIFKQVAHDYQGQLPEFVRITYPYIDEDERPLLLGKLGLNKSELPQIMAVIYSTQNQLLKYKFTPSSNDSFSSEELIEFIENYKQGQVPIYMKSQPIIAPKPGSLVHPVVRENFNTTITDSKQHNLLIITAEWCKACKNIIEKLETLLQQDIEENIQDKLTFHTLDLDKNDIEGITVESYPTIYLVNKNQPKNENYLYYPKHSDINELYHFLRQQLPEIIPELQKYSQETEYDQEQYNNKNQQEQENEKIDL